MCSIEMQNFAVWTRSLSAHLRFVSALYQHSFQKTEHETASMRVCTSVRASGEHAEGMCTQLGGRSPFCWISLQASFWIGGLGWFCRL